MRRKAFATILVISFLAIGALTIAQEAEAHPLDGTWDLWFDWDPPGTPYNAQWYVKMLSDKFGKFDDSQGNSGWVLNPTGNVVMLIYTSGCRPIYYSNNFTGTTMSGKMLCRPPSAGKGTWEATKIASSKAKPPKGDGSPACPQ